MWVTNNPEAAKALREADAAYERAIKEASGMKLAMKVAHLRQAKKALYEAYAAVGQVN